MLSLDVCPGRSAPPILRCRHGGRAAGSLHSNLPSFVVTCPRDTLAAASQHLRRRPGGPRGLPLNSRSARLWLKLPACPPFLSWKPHRLLDPSKDNATRASEKLHRRGFRLIDPDKAVTSVWVLFSGPHKNLTWSRTGRCKVFL